MTPRRYHVTTFGCQMNEHDSERMRGMLESLGYAEAPERAQADLILFNTCSIRETADNRLLAHLGEAKRLKRERSRSCRRRRRLLGAVAEGRGVRALPVRRRRLRPRSGAQARRVPDQRLADARRATSSSRGSPGDLPAKRARARSRGGFRSASAATAPAPTASCRPRAGARSAVRSRTSWPRARRMAADGVREITLLGQNVNSYGRDLRPARASFARLLARADAIDGHRPDPLHEPAPQGHARGRRPRPRRAARRSASTSTCRCSRAPRAILQARCGAPTTASATSIAWR